MPRHCGTPWRPVWRRCLLALVLVVGITGASMAWVGLRGQQVRAHLDQAGELVRQFQQQMRSRDLVAARVTLTALQEQTRSARSATDGVDWRIGATLPGVGADVAAVRTVTAVLDDLSHQALPPMVELADAFDLSALIPTDGWLDLAPLQRAAPTIAVADAAVRRAVQRLSSIDTADLLPELRAGIADLAGELDRLLTLTGTAVRAASLLPPMLGVNGPRTYLVLVQNLAEVRATGGMSGAFVVVRTDRGALRIVDQGSAAAALMAFPEPVLPLHPDMLALYTERLGIFPADVNVTPHFPTAAALAAEMYRRRSGTTVDGVLAVDPVVLSYLLRSTGPLGMPTGPPLTAESAVEVLLSDAYARMASVADKDAYFAAAARTVFDALGRGAANPTMALVGLSRAAGERRLLLWSAHAAEQEIIAGTVLEGSLPVREGTRPVVGVFLNDGSGAKLGYYLTHDARLRGNGCRTDGRVSLSLRVTLGSTAPRSGLPDYVLGLGLAGDPYTVRTNVMIFSPAGGAVVDVGLDGVAVGFGTGVERGRSVGVLTVDLKPGQSRTVDVELLTGPLTDATQVTPELWVTPGVNPWGLDITSAPVCPAVR